MGYGWSFGVAVVAAFLHLVALVPMVMGTRRKRDDGMEHPLTPRAAPTATGAPMVMMSAPVVMSAQPMVVSAPPGAGTQPMVMSAPTAQPMVMSAPTAGGVPYAISAPGVTSAPSYVIIA